MNHRFYDRCDTRKNEKNDKKYGSSNEKVPPWRRQRL
jgi:hypothetical protein